MKPHEKKPDSKNTENVTALFWKTNWAEVYQFCQYNLICGSFKDKLKQDQ